MKNILLTVTAAAAALFALPAMADDGGASFSQFQFNSNNMYMGANAGWGHVSNSSGYSGDSKSGFGWNLNTGYNFSSQIAGELGYTKFPGKTFDVFNSAGNHALYLAAKGTLPLQQGYSLFGKAGVAYAHHYLNPGSKNGVGGYFGAGVGYQVEPDLSFLGEFDTLAFGSNSLPFMYLISGGVSYSFAN